MCHDTADRHRHRQKDAGFDAIQDRHNMEPSISYGYQDEGYIYMDILAWDFRGCMIGLMESALIIHFQKEQPRLCLNVKKGDDNRQNISPQFLYVAYLP